MHTIWIVSENAVERESMELFLSQNDFTVRTFSSLAGVPQSEGAVVDAVVCSTAGDGLPSLDALSALRGPAVRARVYLLGDGFSREEIVKLLQIGVNGIFKRPLRPLSIIQKLKDDLSERGGEATRPALKAGGGSTLALGTQDLMSEAWHQMANTILNLEDIPPVLFVESPSGLIFRYFVEKLQRRLKDAHLVFLDGSEAVVRAGVVAEIEYGQWRRPPVAAIYAKEVPRMGLIDFFLKDIGLQGAKEDTLIRLVLGSRYSLASVLEAGGMDAATAEFLRAAELTLPGGDAFAGDWERLLEFRVRELAAPLDAAERSRAVVPDDLFKGTLSTELTELEAFAHWLSARLSFGKWPADEELRALASHIEVFAKVPHSCFWAEDEVEARAAIAEDALARIARNLGKTDKV